MVDVTGLDNIGQLGISDVAGGAQIAFATNTILLIGVASTALTEAQFQF